MLKSICGSTFPARIANGRFRQQRGIVVLIPEGNGEIIVEPRPSTAPPQMGAGADLARCGRRVR
jgi:hypothetical protein